MAPTRDDRDRHLRVIDGTEVYFDWEGFLWDPETWTEAIAEVLAAEQGIARLSDAQWQVIHFMREFYFYEGRSPMNKDLKKGTGYAIMELEEMFPAGVRLGARLIAGLPNPKACL